ncbi:hypothetical protein HK102_003454 [Quaeritorhiza haematococci]|nr:hypothetical protein HK102_003454 [Quaeritorhiza haematococci]
MALQVIDFLDTYRMLCEEKNEYLIESITKNLEQAVDGSEPSPFLKLAGNTPELRYHRIDDTYCNDILFPSIRKSGATFITDIDISYNELGDKAAISLAEYLKFAKLTAPNISKLANRQADKYIRVLKLNSNQIGAKGCTALAHALHDNVTLSQLEIGYNAVGDEGGMQMAAMLQINTTLHQLSLRGCGITAQTLIALSTVLQSNDTLEAIDISDNSNHTSSLTQSLANDIMMHISRALKLNHNHIKKKGGKVSDSEGEDENDVEGRNRWSAQHRHRQRGLRELTMAKMQITDWSVADFLAEGIRSSGLVKLDVSGNRISRVGGVAILQALHKHPTLRTLSLSCCSILDEGAEAVAEMLLNNNHIRCLRLDHNGITGRGLVAIAAALGSSYTPPAADGGTVSRRLSRRDTNPVPVSNKAVNPNRTLVNITLWGNKWDVTACEAFAPLLGGPVDDLKVGHRDDEIPDKIWSAVKAARGPHTIPYSRIYGNPIISNDSRSNSVGEDDHDAKGVTKHTDFVRVDEIAKHVKENESKSKKAGLAAAAGNGKFIEQAFNVVLQGGEKEDTLAQSAPRLLTTDVDFVIYAVEGVLNVAKKEYA